ncbi:MAG: hypothetical protein ETSY1_09710 [Candidatus Entotheonella factor]|uniref:Thioesterase domain-containing protein n=1 Tax=Entotheonella factor TaxID=1429438 RepID=W4LS95_ENTF1|nr:MAG: hypothetical protein ETSY1_09710 [Candidatus Entotheonella factor]
MPALSERDLKALIVSNLPPVDQHDEIVEAVGEDWVRLRLPFRQDYLGTDLWLSGDGVVFSGPLVMGFADTVMYSCVHAMLGRDVIAVMVNLMVTFLRPAKAADIMGHGRLIRKGKRHAYVEVYLYSDGDAEPIAHVTSTHSIAARPAD